MAISSSGCGWPLPSSRCSCSISSPIARASSSESQQEVTCTFSPGTSSVRSVLPSRPSLWAIRCEAAARMWPVRAVVALEPDDLGAGEIVLEAQDVVDLGAAPAVDRLVVVADAADVLERGALRRARCARLSPLAERVRVRALTRECRSPLTRLARADSGLARSRRPGDDGGGRAPLVRLPQQPQPQILRDVGVLILVHQDVVEARADTAAAPRAARGTGGCIPAAGRRSRRR